MLKKIVANFADTKRPLIQRARWLAPAALLSLTACGPSLTNIWPTTVPENPSSQPTDPNQIQSPEIELQMALKHIAQTMPTGLSQHNDPKCMRVALDDFTIGTKVVYYRAGQTKKDNTAFEFMVTEKDVDLKITFTDQHEKLSGIRLELRPNDKKELRVEKAILIKDENLKPYVAPLPSDGIGAGQNRYALQLEFYSDGTSHTIVDNEGRETLKKILAFARKVQIDMAPVCSGAHPMIYTGLKTHGLL